jgi:hypothetical protein
LQNIQYEGNLGFGHPRTDVCSRSLELAAKIKKKRDSVKKKSNLVATKRVYVVRAKAFFYLVKEQRPDLITLSFDCQRTFLSLSFQTRWFPIATSYICIILPLLRVLPQKNYHLVESTAIAGQRMSFPKGLFK